MRFNRILLSTALVVFALLFQVTVLARLRLPGAVPDLMLLVVLALALVYGHTGGCLVGFGAGLLTDLAPPADHAVGRYALVLSVIGYLAGLAKPESGKIRTATGPLAVVVTAAAGTTLLYAGVGVLIGDRSAGHVGFGSLILTAALYDLLLAPFVVPAVMWLARRAESNQSADASSAAGGDMALRGFGLSNNFLGGGMGRGWRISRFGGPAGGRGGLLGRSPKAKVGRIKGVKRL